MAIRFPFSWPLPRDTLLQSATTLTPGLMVEFWATTEGRLEAWFTYQGERQVAFTSARLNLPIGGEGTIFIGWGDAGVRMTLGGDPIPARGEVGDVHRLELTPHFPGPGTLSFNDSYADANCAPWVAWRNEHLLSNEVPAGRTLKTLDEQLDELRDAAARMRVLLHLLDANEWRWLGSLAVELRALVVWKDSDFLPKNAKRQKNIPLLFRVAAYRDLPLPVYMLAPQREGPPEGVYLRFDPFTLTHTSGHQRVADIQQWLSHPAMFAPGVLAWDMKKLIGQFTETKGPGHYDTGVPSAIDFLSRSRGSKVSVAEQFIYRVGEGVVILCDYVLAHFDVSPERPA